MGLNEVGLTIVENVHLNTVLDLILVVVETLPVDQEEEGLVVPIEEGHDQHLED